MTDLGDCFKGLKEESKLRRAEYRDNAPQILTSRKIQFDIRNDGAHLIVHCTGGKIDFWPGTGLWVCRTMHTPKDNRGIMRLVEFIKKAESND